MTQEAKSLKALKRKSEVKQNLKKREGEGGMGLIKGIGTTVCEAQT